ncbi:MAG TPA: MFS transporter [Acidimicrobiales bacterium]|nr:MFS transporter [Acidimicrobiales bacterium]
MTGAGVAQQRGRRVLSPSGRGTLAGCLLVLACGWNLSNIGAVASTMAHAYGVSLATVGLLTTSIFVTHTAAQIPAGRVADRSGGVRAGGAGLVLIALGDLIALQSAQLALAIVGRAVSGLGTALSFVAGNALVRDTGGSASAQGLFGGIGLGAGGLALAVVPQVTGWRAPYWTSLALVVPALVVLPVVALPAPGATSSARAGRLQLGMLLDRRLYRLSVLYSCTYGAAVVSANWVIELLRHHSSLSHAAEAVVGGLSLLLAVASRPLGGWVLHNKPGRVRSATACSLLAGALGTVGLLVGRPAWAPVSGAVLVGLGAGISFAPTFTGAAASHPEAPAAAVGLVNMVANLCVLVGTPLAGLSFSLPGQGRIAFAVIAALWLVAWALLPSSDDLGARTGGSMGPMFHHRSHLAGDPEDLLPS